MLADHFLRAFHGSSKSSSFTSRPRSFTRIERMRGRHVRVGRKTKQLHVTDSAKIRASGSDEGAGGARAVRATRWRLRHPSDGFAMKSARTGISMDIKGVVQRRVSSWRLKCQYGRGIGRSAFFNDVGPSLVTKPLEVRHHGKRVFLPAVGWPKPIERDYAQSRPHHVVCRYRFAGCPVEASDGRSSG